MKTLLFLYNPHAGKGRLLPHLGELAVIFQKAGYLVTLYMTTGPGDGARAAAEMAEHYDRVVCAGGDGTLSEVVRGLMSCENPPVLGYIPAGTTNDFSRTLGIPADPKAAAELAAGDHVRRCDVGRFNATTFLYVAAFGAFTRVSYDTPQEIKNHLGHAAYVLSGIRSLGEIASYPMHIRADDITIDGDFIYGMVSDSVSIGGFRGIATDRVVLDDGLFELLLIQTPRSLSELNAIIASLLAQKPHGNVIALQASHVEFSCHEPIAWTLDGEFGGEVTHASISALPSAIRLIRGKEAL